MCVADICRREVVTIGPRASLVEAATLMREKHVGMLVVVEPVPAGADRIVQGVLTDRDIVTTVVGRDTEPGTLSVGDVMTRSPLLAAEDQTVAAVLRHMRDVGVRRIPVVGTRSQLVGVLSLDDILDGVAEQLMTISAAIRSEQGRERMMRP
jgi:CBS domain-containing protein